MREERGDEDEGGVSGARRNLMGKGKAGGAEEKKRIVKVILKKRTFAPRSPSALL